MAKDIKIYSSKYKDCSREQQLAFLRFKKRKEKNRFKINNFSHTYTHWKNSVIVLGYN